MARSVKHDHDQIFDVAFQPLRDIFQVVGYGRVEFHGILARGADDYFFHVAVGSVEQASAFGGGEHGDGSGGSSGAEVGAFERIDGDVDFGNLGAIGKFGADFFADVEHGRLVSLALADDDGAAHGNGLHGLPHGLGRDLV